MYKEASTLIERREVADERVQGKLVMEKYNDGHTDIHAEGPIPYIRELSGDEAADWLRDQSLFYSWMDKVDNAVEEAREKRETVFDSPETAQITLKNAWKIRTRGGDVYRMNEFSDGSRACWLHRKSWLSDSVECYAALGSGSDLRRIHNGYKSQAESIRIDPSMYSDADWTNITDAVLLGHQAGSWGELWNSVKEYVKERNLTPVPRLAATALTFLVASRFYISDCYAGAIEKNPNPLRNETAVVQTIKPEEAPHLFEDLELSQDEPKVEFPNILTSRMGAKIDTEYQPVSGSDYSRFGFSLFEIDKNGKPVFGDVARVFLDSFPDGTVRTNAGARVPFDFGYKGNLAIYGMEHEDDEGLGFRLTGSYQDWLLNGVFERAEFGGKNQGLKGLGIGRIFHSDLGKTRVEFWGYDKIGEKIGNIFLFQNFPDGYQGGLSFTGGDESERDFSMSFGRCTEKKSWRFHGGTALDGEAFSLGGIFITEPDPRFATTPYGYLNTGDGVKSYQTLWKHAMGFYPGLKLFEKGTFVLHADYFHNKDSERVLTQVSVRPFQLMDSDSELLRGIHLGGKYDWNHSNSGHDSRLTGGLGIQYKDINLYIEKAEEGEPVFGLQLIRMF